MKFGKTPQTFKGDGVVICQIQDIYKTFTYGNVIKDIFKVPIPCTPRSPNPDWPLPLAPRSSFYTSSDCLFNSLYWRCVGPLSLACPTLLAVPWFHKTNASCFLTPSTCMKHLIALPKIIPSPHWFLIITIIAPSLWAIQPASCCSEMTLAFLPARALDRKSSPMLLPTYPVLSHFTFSLSALHPSHPS